MQITLENRVIISYLMHMDQLEMAQKCKNVDNTVTGGFHLKLKSSGISAERRPGTKDPTGLGIGERSLSKETCHLV